MNRKAQGHGHTPLYWYSASLQAFSDWAAARKLIQTKTPLEEAAERAQLAKFSTDIQLRNQVEGERKPAFGDGSQDYMMTRYKNLALINISGTLVSGDSYWNRYFGLVSYAEIRRSIMLALEDRSVDGVLATMNTPGGNASGADSLATFFKKTDQVKPFYVFAETEMCSGGYYLGAPAREVYAQRAALIGSVGVVMVHMDLLDMHMEMGVKPTVFRAGEFKALGSPYEHLDKKATQVIQGTLDNYFDMFNAHVVDCRGYADEAAFRNTAGEGRVFMAEEAKEVGLVDQVAEMEETLEEVSDKSRRGSGRSSQLSVITNLKGTKLMNYDQVMALVASGVKLTAEQQAILDAGPGTTEENPADPQVEANADTPAIEDPQTADPQVSADPAAEPKPAADAATLDRVVELSTKLGQAESKVSMLEADKAKLQSDLDGMQATMGSLQAIVCQAISHRQIALGFQPSAPDQMTPAQQVELYNKLDGDFKERFKGGQVSRPTSAEPSASATLSPTPVAKAAQHMTGKL